LDPSGTAIQHHVGKGRILAIQAQKVDPETAALYRAAARMSAPTLIEGPDLQESYEAFVRALLGPGVPKTMRQLARWTLIRIGAYELAERLCDFATFGEWAKSERNPIFLQQLPRVRNRGDRLALLEQHRTWAAGLEQIAAQSPVVRAAARERGKIRLGLLSSGFCRHVVGHFALPLFEFPDERFELYAYSLQSPEDDDLQPRFASLSTFRDQTTLKARDAAQMIADDDLDMLIELDGVTGSQALEIMAYRPAPLQASWLGYPHSSGLSTIDHIILDRQIGTDFVLEKPLLMPETWLALSPTKFHDAHVIDPTIPERRNGFLTFGTLGNPYKFTLDSLRGWARIVARHPGSKFLFGRPEAAAPSFQNGMRKRFAAEGVDGERLIFATQKGRHMTLYNGIDIALDTYPLVGGTSTADALWMGVPVISLTGEAPFERLSSSLLASAGIGDLAVETVEAYEAAATALAADVGRRIDLRQKLRTTLKQGPIGQPVRFASQFYDLIDAAVRTARAGT
jgi:predicted O-linked N-acetylglucosamine transferase (SPINDLY family)